MPSNQFLATLPSSARDLLLPFLECVNVASSDIVISAGRPVKNVYFPEGGPVFRDSR